MAKFVYRMQNILELKEKIEEQEKMAFSLANMKLQEEQQRLADLIVRRQGYEAELAELTQGKLNIREIKRCKEAINAMRSKIRDQMMEVAKAQKAVDAARARLDEVMKDRKTHEKLREKAFEEFKKELLAEESKETDQLISFTYQNKTED